MADPTITQRHCRGDQCLFKAKKDTKDQLRCTICCIWHHAECVSVKSNEKQMVWTCFDCRQLMTCVRSLQSEIKTLKDNQSKMMDIMQKISKSFEDEETRRIKAEEQLEGVKQQLTDLSNQLANHMPAQMNEQSKEPPQATPTAPPLPNLLLGTSLLRNVNPDKLENWEVISKGGATIDDLNKKINELPNDKTYNEVVIVAGSIDLENKSAEEIVGDYQALNVTLGLISQKITISSILPRSDKELKSKTNEVNEALTKMCNDEGPTFVNNDLSFHLLNGKINDAYLMDDGLHLTKKGLDSLLHNCNVLKSGSAFTPQKYPNPENKNPVMFKGHKDPLSNFYPIEIQFEGRSFTSTEAAYQHSKAITMGDYDSAHKIIHAENALHAMRIASKIKTNEIWKRKKVEVMKSLIKEKIRVCKAAKSALQNSGNRQIVEDTNHEFWGRGRSKKGLNMLGNIWMQYRDQLQRDPNFAGHQNRNEIQNRNDQPMRQQKPFKQRSQHYRPQRNRPQDRNWATRDQQPRCYRCGEAGHGFMQCRQPDSMSCWACGRAGHKRKHCSYYSQHSRSYEVYYRDY